MLISGLLNNVNVFNDILEGINIQATAGIFTLSLPFYFISKRSSCLNAYLELIKKYLGKSTAKIGQGLNCSMVEKTKIGQRRGSLPSVRKKNSVIVASRQKQAYIHNGKLSFEAQIYECRETCIFCHYDGDKNFFAKPFSKIGRRDKNMNRRYKS